MFIFIVYYRGKLLKGNSKNNNTFLKNKNKISYYIDSNSYKSNHFYVLWW